jgi:hypothetical protein
MTCPANLLRGRGEAWAGASAWTTYTQYDGALSIAVQYLEVRTQLRYNLVGSFFLEVGRAVSQATSGQAGSDDRQRDGQDAFGY